MIRREKIFHVFSPKNSISSDFQSPNLGYSKSQSPTLDVVKFWPISISTQSLRISDLDLSHEKTHLADHEQHCDELVPLKKETLDALLTITERIEINKLVKGVQDEIEKARNVLTDIRETLKSDGPKVAIETRELKLERSPNPIREAKRLL